MGDPSLAWGLFSLFRGIDSVSTDDNAYGVARPR